MMAACGPRFRGDFENRVQPMGGGGEGGGKGEGGTEFFSDANWTKIC